jgi:NADH-quinone oxidoreductase subunit C
MTTTVIPGTEVAERIAAVFPGAVIEATQHSVTIGADQLVEVARFLRDDEELDCKFLNTLLGVDWLEHFDVVYVLSSLAKNHTLVLEARTMAHEEPVVPSVSGVWQGAHLQEREVYDLMGIAFSGHPALKRIFLWDGFPGHPLRKDFLALPGGYRPGLQRFPYEFPAGQRAYPNLAAPDGPRAPAVPLLREPLAGQAAAEETGGGQLGVGGGGSTQTRTAEARNPGVEAMNPAPGETEAGGSAPATDETAGIENDEKPDTESGEGQA